MNLNWQGITEYSGNVAEENSGGNAGWWDKLMTGTDKAIDAYNAYQSGKKQGSAAPAQSGGNSSMLLMIGVPVVLLVIVVLFFATRK